VSIADTVRNETIAAESHIFKASMVASGLERIDGGWGVKGPNPGEQVADWAWLQPALDVLASSGWPTATSDTWTSRAFYIVGSETPISAKLHATLGTGTSGVAQTEDTSLPRIHALPNLSQRRILERKPDQLRFCAEYIDKSWQLAQVRRDRLPTARSRSANGLTMTTLRRISTETRKPTQHPAPATPLYNDLVQRVVGSEGEYQEN
jgi:hypothetical protein